LLALQYNSKYLIAMRDLKRYWAVFVSSHTGNTDHLNRQMYLFCTHICCSTYFHNINAMQLQCYSLDVVI